ncbi:general secretion pathway protein GspB [Pontiella agarivorans]|uniref:General secretion pathway protein GspB n=1 Tax=Pontiella agarivorans TaxID=3038953 RepID=A0ABU5MYY6_9BACT|nr:general secretion pathway protein GspB [Pontiella agarivorans]MDZ8119387.1 general secretion pathway protein GspB [Pontiella agarivorans]
MSSGLSTPDERVAGEKRPVRPAVMVITMVLMIAVLMLTAVMMIYYATLQQNESTGSSVTEKPAIPGETGQALSFLKTLTAHSTTPPDDAETGNGSSFSLFGKTDGNIRWPKLSLTGHGRRPDGSGAFAIINGHQYQPGQIINGKVKIIEIREHDVLVEFSGETNSLIVDVHN